MQHSLAIFKLYLTGLKLIPAYQHHSILQLMLKALGLSSSHCSVSTDLNLKWFLLDEDESF